MPTQRIPWTRLFAEGAIIVVSILLAFAIDAWWDSAQERSREDAYLRQLVSDLESTLENNARFSALADSVDWIEPRLVRLYYEADPPPRDSVADWLVKRAYWVVQPRLGTVEALVRSGDLALIRDEALRADLIDYLTSMQAFKGFEEAAEERYLAAGSDLSRHIDQLRIRIEALTPAARDSIVASNPLAPVPSGRLRPLPPAELVTRLRTPDVHQILFRMLGAKTTMRAYRDLMKASTERLLERVREVQSS